MRDFRRTVYDVVTAQSRWTIAWQRLWHGSTGSRRTFQISAFYTPRNPTTQPMTRDLFTAK